ncbi:MAG: hypothetical protein EPO22_03980, partial [Dehalococcoidia bacterium]
MGARPVRRSVDDARYGGVLRGARDQFAAYHRRSGVDDGRQGRCGAVASLVAPATPADVARRTAVGGPAYRRGCGSADRACVRPYAPRAAISDRDWRRTRAADGGDSDAHRHPDHGDAPAGALTGHRLPRAGERHGARRADRNLRHAACRRIRDLPGPAARGLRRLRLHAADACHLRLTGHRPTQEAARMIVAAVLCLVLLPVAAAVATWTLGLRRRAGPLCVAVSVVMLLAAFALFVRVQDRGPQSAFGDWVYVDSLGVLVLTLITIVGVCGALNSQPYIAHDLARGELRPQDETRYYALFLAFMATMAAVPVVNNLGVMWVAIEATTVVSVLLVSIYRTGRSLEAAWKYLVLGSVGIALALFGTMMTYYAASATIGESASALNWTELRAASVRLDPDVMRLAFIFVLVGYGTKVGLAPMHTWLPDAHSQAPSPISGLLSGVLLNCALYAVLRFRVLTIDAVGGSYADHLLIGFGLFSVALAVPFLLVQHDIKRMLG